MVSFQFFSSDYGTPHILCPNIILFACTLLMIVSDSTESLTAALSGANSLVVAVGFVPSNPLKMAQAAHEVE